MKKIADDQRIWRLFAVFAIAMLARAVYLLSIRHAPFFDHLVTEPARYDAWARDIVRGVAPVRPPFDEGPAYPYFVALVYAIAGHNVFAVTTLQALMDAGSCVLVAATAERMSGARAAWIAGVLAALYGPMIYFTGQLEPATMTVFVTSLALFLTPVRSATRLDWIVCGAMWAIAMLVRSEMILALPIVFFHAWRIERREALVATTAAPAIGLLVITLAINAASSGHAVLLTTGGGVNFWIGNNAHADGVNPFLEGGPMRQVAHEIERQTSDAVVADGLFRDRGLSFIAHEPARAFALFAKKALWLFSDRELPNAMDIERQERASFLFALPIFPLRFGMVFPLALAGIVTRGKKIPAHLFAPIAIAFVVAVVFFTCARFRMVMSPALFVFAAFAFDSKLLHWKKIVAAVLGAFLAFANIGDVRGYRIKEIDELMQTLYIARGG